MLHIQRPRRRSRFPTTDPRTPGGQKASGHRRDAASGPNPLRRICTLSGEARRLVRRCRGYRQHQRNAGRPSVLKPMAVAHYLRAVSPQGHRKCDRKAGLLPGRPTRRFTLRSAVMRVRSASSNGAGSVCRADISGAFFPCLSHRYGLAQDAITCRSSPYNHA